MASERNKKIKNNKKRVRHRKVKKDETKISILKTILDIRNDTINLSKFLNQILGRIIKIFQLDGGYISLLNEEKKELTLMVHKGLSDNFLTQFSKIKIGKRFVGKRFKTQRMIIVQNVDEFPAKLKSLLRDEKITFFMDIPLVTKGKAFGTLTLINKNKIKLSLKDLESIKTIGFQIALIIDNEKLHNDLVEFKKYLQRADRLATIGTMTTGIVHEIRNPLVSIKAFLQLLPEKYDDKEFRENFHNIAVDEVNRLDNLLNRLLDFARPPDNKMDFYDINRIIEKMLSFIENEAAYKNISIHKELDRELPPILVNEEQVKQVFLNLFQNAIHATGNNGKLDVISRRKRHNKRDFLQIELRDTGKGIDKEGLQNIFNPFFTTKNKGMGLGLAIT
ncbi:MAG TPA: ATP-binding protein, partial [Nitrospinota bacterium]|nr:ATP-binding protein [Nitrospinota bacterium]